MQMRVALAHSASGCRVLFLLYGYGPLSRSGRSLRR